MADTFTEEQLREANRNCEERGKQGFAVNNVVLRELFALEPSEQTKWKVWLASDEGKADLQALHHVSHSEKRSQLEFARIKRNYYNRQPFRKYEPHLSTEDICLRLRKEDIKSGKRRR